MKQLLMLLLLLGLQVTYADADDANKQGGQEEVQLTELPSWGNGAPSLMLNLPKGFTYTQQKGPDFDVHQFRHPGDIGVLSIYIGHHPQRVESKGAKELKKSVGSKVVQFRQQSKQYGTFTDAVVTDFFKGDKGQGVESLVIHIFMHVKDKKFYDSAWTILASLKKSKQD